MNEKIFFSNLRNMRENGVIKWCKSKNKNIHLYLTLLEFAKEIEDEENTIFLENNINLINCH